VQDRIHEVTGAVPGKRSPGTISTMCAGSESKDQDARFGVPEARYRAGPVGLVLIRAATLLAYAPAVFSQAGAAFAGDDGVLNL
jgi:hypothetical protein